MITTTSSPDGHMLQHWSVPPGCNGTYAVSGDTVTFRERVHCHGLFTAGWSLGNGQTSVLHLLAQPMLVLGDEILFGAEAVEEDRLTRDRCRSPHCPAVRAASRRQERHVARPGLLPGTRFLGDK